MFLEKWIDVVGFEGLYMVSNFGRVYAKKKTRTNGINGSIIKVYPARIMKLSKNRDGYVRVKLMKSSKAFYFTVHRLVAISFFGFNEKRKQVNHISGVKDNNSTVNLEWSTPTENMRHAMDNKLKPVLFGEDVGGSKLREEDVLFIRSSFSTQLKMAKKFNVSVATISYIRSRKTWKHLK